MAKKRATNSGILLGLLVLLLLVSCQQKSGSQEQTIHNLRAFTKLYGYVRFFHPSDEASEMDWDKLAIYGAERVKNAKNAKELKARLEELFLPVAPNAKIYFTDEKSQETLPEAPRLTASLKVVAWQHKGVGFGSAASVYRSIRLNRDNILTGGQGAAVLAQLIDAKDFRGKEIRLKASVKTEVSGMQNQAQLWLRVNKAGNELGFFDNMADRPITAKDWKEYEITGKVDDDALSVSVGAIFSGSGKAWLDDFQVSIKDDSGPWKPVEVGNPGFEEGDVDKKPRSWAAQSQGYDYKVKADNAPNGENCLLIESSSTVFKGRLFDAAPAAGEFVDKELGAGLSCRVPLALYSSENNTLGRNDAFPLETLNSAMEAHDFGDMSANLESVRLADIVIAWNIFQHFYPYFAEVDVDWDAELTYSLGRALTDTHEKEFFLTLSRMVAQLQDGHGNVYDKYYMQQVGFPIRLEWIEEQVVVTATEDPEHFQQGDIIVSIDGIPAREVVLDAEQYISGSPQWKRSKVFWRFGYGEKGTAARFELKRGEETLEFEVVRSSQKMVAEPTRPNVEELDNNVFYINLDLASWQEINAQIDDLAQAHGLILDMRGYPNGNHEIISHLLTENDTSDAWMQVPQTIYPDQENLAGYQKMGWKMPAKKPHIGGKVVFITDGRAISYAESFMGFIEFYKLGEIVGGPTAGANGNINPFVLPGDLRVIYTGMRVVKHDGTQHHTIGIQPTVPMTRTLQGVKDGRDELFEKALEIITTK